MKYYKILTLLLIGLVFVSFSFANAGDENQTSVGQQVKRAVETDLAPGKMSTRTIDMMLADPKPTKLTAARLSKITAPVGPYSGTYTIPGSFSSINEAITLLNAFGLSGPTFFELTAASYTEVGVTIGSYTGNTNLLTIRPAAGVAVTINFMTSTIAGKGFAFNGAKNVTIDGINAGSSLTLQYPAGYPFPTGDAFAATIYVAGGSDNITVQNANIKGNIQTAGSFFDQTAGRPAVFVFRSATSAANTNITITQCTITNATFGLKALTETFGNTQGPITYSYNKVGTAFGASVCHGAIVDEVFGIHYDYNEIDGVEFVPEYWNNGTSEYDNVATFAAPNEFLYGFGQHSAGHFYNYDANSTIKHNYIKNVVQNYNDPGFQFNCYGMLVRVGSGAKVTNNRITDISTIDANGIIVGLRNEAQAWHNSIWFKPTGPAMLAGQTSYCMRAAGGTTYNNAFSNELPGGAGANQGAYSGTPSGLCDGNAAFSLGRISLGSATLQAYLGTLKDLNSTFGPLYFLPDLYIDNTQPTAASNVGYTPLPAPGVLIDIDGVTRNSPNPDAGADEFADAPLMPVNVLTVLIPSPTSAGVPSGVAHNVQPVVKNNSNQAAGPFNVTVTITGIEGYNNNVPITLNSRQGLTVTTLPQWTPAVGQPSPRVITASHNAGDPIPGDDIYFRNQIVADPTVPIGCYDFNTSAQGWTAQTGPPNTTATTDWVRSSTFTKLGGVYTGTGASWVTRRPIVPADHNALVTEGAYASSQGYATTYPGPNILTSPYWNLSGLPGTDLYISFVHSIRTEPKWDFSMIQYTLDGVNWNVLDSPNPLDKINWYSSALYSTPSSGDYDAFHCIDELTWETRYGLGEIPENGFPIWSSKGDCDLGTIEGPSGWVFVQLKVTDPAIARASVIRFRYLAFSDAATGFEGWAFDNFCVGNTGASFTGGKISGVVFHDLNGNGINDDSSPNIGDSVTLSYYGVYKASTITTAPNGAYEFDTFVLNNGLPGVYNVQLVKPGYAFTLPFGTTGIANVNHDGLGGTVTQDFGKYQGFVSGIKFNDRYDDSLYTPGVDPPLSGWTIEVHKDSANGLLIGSAVTAANGTYTVLAPAYFWGGTNPGNYVVKEIAQPTKARQTFPAAPGKYTIQVTGTSGPTNIIPDINFGNFVFGVITCEVVQDRNGNGVRGAEDSPPLLPGTPKVYIDVFKNQVKIGTDTLSDGSSPKIHRELDKGIYGFKRMNAIPTGHIETAPASANPPSPTDVLDSITVVVDTCGTVKSASFLYFQLISVTGVKFEDKDGSGSFTGGDVGADGWTINISGSVYGSASAVTHDGGNYTISDVGPGSHIISETLLNTDWVQTFPVGGIPYPSFVAITASQGGNQTAKNFGNFKKFCVSGIKFRDRNCDGIQDEDEEPLAGWTMNLTGNTPIVTGEDGTFEWCDLLPGSYTLSETPQGGWTASTPPAGTITFSGISGDAKVVPFGNCKAADNTKYRTFTYEQLRECDQQKKQNPPALTSPSTKKPWYAPHLVGDLVRQIMATELAVLVVGEKDLTYPWGKKAAWLEPAKFGDVSATLVKCVKGVGTYHIGPSQPFNTYGSSVMSKRYKKILPTKKSDMLIAELLTLQVNLAASDKGNTPTGLGAVIYPSPGPWGTTATIDAIEAYANKIMTNWAAGMVVPQPVNPTDYDALYTAVREINLAFASTSIVDTTPDGGWRAPKFKYVGIKTALEAGFLAPTAAPKVRPVGTPEVIPDVYALGQNYPNPFNPTTILSFELPSDAVVTLTIYNLLGQEVATVLDRQEYSAGTYEEYFDASQLASGVYLYRIVVEEIGDDGSTGQSFTQVKKMVLMK